jgi:hypothetical protein
MCHTTYLFNKYDWFSVQENIKNQLLNEVAGMDGNRLLNTSVDDLSKYFENKYCVNVPSLLEDNIVVDQKEAQVDVSHDRMRAIRDRSHPSYISGTAIDVTIPFEGDAEIFNIKPTQYTLNPPSFEISGNNLIVVIQGVELQADKVKAEIDRTISDVRMYLNNLQRDADGLNRQLNILARNVIDRRRQKLLADQNLVTSLGFPLKKREGSPKTYVTPDVRRKIRPTMPPAIITPYKPEPTLSNDDYLHILSIIQNMAQVMERSPTAFASIDEESLRSHFLVQLNGHYEGQATGETFNYEGKTDILIRVDGKNIFIAECKYWGGPQKLTETIDQLLGYTSWRDTKVAIIIFNRRKNFSKVLEVIPGTVGAHKCFKRSLGQVTDTSYQYIFSNRDDPNREMILTILAFDVPEN